MSIIGSNVLAGASGSAQETLYVDDVFKSQLYRGNATADTDINQGGDGIDLTSGGMVFIAGRTATKNHQVYDSARGISDGYLNPAVNSLPTTDANGITSFNSDGFTLGNGTNANSNGTDFVGWCFKKQKGFFDVVTYTGNGTAGKTVSHGLGSAPGMIWIKRASGGASNWAVYHRSRGSTKCLPLDTTTAESTGTSFFNDTDPTSTVFTVGTDARVNNDGDEYVAYVFAHDDQSFGEDGDQAIIECGQYLGSGNTNNFIDLGFEPQWLIIRKAANTGNWHIFDDMRGLGSGASTQGRIYIDTTGAEAATNVVNSETEGFRVVTTATGLNATNEPYIYCAIRQRNKPAESGTDVFTCDAAGLSEAANRITLEADHRVDMFMGRHKTATVNTHMYDRFRGNGRELFWNVGNGETATTQQILGHFDFHTGVGTGSQSGNMTSHVGWLFKRAPGFFDIVRYRGDGTSTRTINHNLGVSPEWIWVKNMETGYAWYAWHKSFTNVQTYHLLQGTAGSASFGNTTLWSADGVSPTATTFKVGGSLQSNHNGVKMVAYLWATQDGVSKVGTYSGTGSDIDVDCGFTGGARFVIIKRTNTSGSNFYVFDSSRGMASGNDPHFKLNTTTAEATSGDYIDQINGGFRIKSTSVPADLNASGSTYLFMAIA